MQLFMQDVNDFNFRDIKEFCYFEEHCIWYCLSQNFDFVYNKINTDLEKAPRGSGVPHHPNFKVNKHLQKLFL